MERHTLTKTPHDDDHPPDVPRLSSSLLDIDLQRSADYATYHHQCPKTCVDEYQPTRRESPASATAELPAPARAEPLAPAPFESPAPTPAEPPAPHRCPDARHLVTSAATAKPHFSFGLPTPPSPYLTSSPRPAALDAPPLLSLEADVSALFASPASPVQRAGGTSLYSSLAARPTAAPPSPSFILAPADLAAPAPDVASLAPASDDRFRTQSLEAGSTPLSAAGHRVPPASATNPLYPLAISRPPLRAPSLAQIAHAASPLNPTARPFYGSSPSSSSAFASPLVAPAVGHDTPPPFALPQTVIACCNHSVVATQASPPCAPYSPFSSPTSASPLSSPSTSALFNSPSSYCSYSFSPMQAPSTPPTPLLVGGGAPRQPGLVAQLSTPPRLAQYDSFGDVVPHHAAEYVEPSRMQIESLRHSVARLVTASPSKQALRKIVQSYLSQERTSEAHALITMLHANGLPVDAVTYSECSSAPESTAWCHSARATTLRPLCSSRHPAPAMLERPPRRRLSSPLAPSMSRPTRADLVMTAYKKRRRWQTVKLMMRQMDDAGVAADAVTYNILIDACGKSQQLDEAFDAFDEMVRHGLQPGVNTYTSLIDACGKAQQLTRAYELLLRMQQGGVQPNAHTFTTLINSCAHAADIELGIKVLEQMVANGQLAEIGQTTIAPFVTLIRACTKDLLLDRAFAIVHRLLDAGVRLPGLAFHSLIDACCRANELERAFRAIRLMYHNQMAPDGSTYAIVVSACIKEGFFRRALDLLGQMRAEKLPPQQQHYSQLLDVAVHINDGDLAAAVLEAMAAALLAPTPSSLGAAVRMLGGAGHVDLAFAAVLQAQRFGGGATITADTLIALIETCIRNKRLDAVSEPLQHLQSLAEPVEASALVTLIELALDEHAVALRVYGLMKARRAVAPLRAFRALITACVAAADIDSAEAVLAEMHYAGMEPDALVAGAVLTAAAARKESAETCLVRLLPQLLAFVDDRPSMLQQLASACEQHGLHEQANSVLEFAQTLPSSRVIDDQQHHSH